MASKDITSLMSGLNLYSTQRQGAQPLASTGSNTDKPKVHTKPHWRQPCPQKEESGKKLRHQNYKPNGYMQRDNQTRRANKTAKTPEQPSPQHAGSSSQQTVREQRTSLEETPTPDGSLSTLRPLHIYIVQIMRPSEVVEGVFLSLIDANNRALNYLETKHGIKAHELSERRGLFGQATTNAKATKRMRRCTGTLEILTRGGTPWVRVLKKPFYACEATDKEKPIYLSVDQSDGIFVIGAYLYQNEAWEGCRKYWSDLSVCSSMFDLKDWHDNGFHYAQATIAGKLHHWSLKRCKLM